MWEKNETKKKRTQYDDIIVPPLKKYFLLSETKEEHVYIYIREKKYDIVLIPHSI